MPLVDRRTVLCAAMLPISGAVSETASVETAAADAQKAADAPAETPPEVTKTLARYLVAAGYDELPHNVRKEGVRTLLNWVGVAVGGSHHPTIDIATSALGPFSGPPQASLLGRRERFDIMNAAFINGVSKSYFRL